MLAVTVTSRDQCLAVVRWLAVGGCRRRYRHLPSPAVAAASRHHYHSYRICAGNSFTPSPQAPPGDFDQLVEGLWPISTSCPAGPAGA
jgi:hypothetical protein